MPLWEAVAQHIGAVTSTLCSVESVTSVKGGCINQAYHLRGGKQEYFVKLNQRGAFAMFEAEAVGLQELGQAGVIKTPAPICWGQVGAYAYLVLEFLDLHPTRTDAFFVTLGHNLAALHHFTGPYFGWRRDNTIGSTPQLNAPHSSWVSFWRRQRLGYQLDLASLKGYTGNLQQRGETLLCELGAFFPGHEPKASFLHGDLWSGNIARDARNNAVIFDPAVYYGDRETDIAMTELFGGFERGFYAAYEEAYPLPKEYGIRRTLYNLYHILNHLNLFGGYYLVQAEHTIDLLLAELRC